MSGLGESSPARSWPSTVAVHSLWRLVRRGSYSRASAAWALFKLHRSAKNYAVNNGRAASNTAAAFLSWRSLDPHLSDTTACQLLQHCLLRGPISNSTPTARKLLKHLEDCAIDLCCTSVRGTQGLHALRQRETVVYAALLASHHAHVASLAKALTGSQFDGCPQALPPGSKLAMLMDTCYKSVHATPASQQKAVQLMGACAVADAGLYVMLLPELEQIMWGGHHPGNQVAAAAGILDGVFCHIEYLTLDVWQHIMNIMQQMLESQQGRAAGLHLRAVVGIGRLLMHASDTCADLGQTEQLVALLVQSYVQPDSSPRSTTVPGHRINRTSNTQQALGQQDDNQQAMHCFFQEYSKEHADDLANTCVLLICDAIANSILVWNPDTGSLNTRQSHHAFDTVQEASTLRLQCKFLARLLHQSAVPMQAVYDSVCANASDVMMQPDIVKDWLQNGTM
ncbi:TPA: hypothetical protein ACH3X2_011300 [Trebouxia sp. C0005]